MPWDRYPRQLHGAQGASSKFGGSGSAINSRSASDRAASRRVAQRCELSSAKRPLSDLGRPTAVSVASPCKERPKTLLSIAATCFHRKSDGSATVDRPCCHLSHSLAEHAHSSCPGPVHL